MSPSEFILAMKYGTFSLRRYYYYGTIAETMGSSYNSFFFSIFTGLFYRLLGDTCSITTGFACYLTGDFGTYATSVFFNVSITG
jgi:hypothetical protein